MEEGEREGPLGTEGETEGGKPCGAGPWGPGRGGSCDHSASQVVERGPEGRDPGDGQPGKEEELQSGAVNGLHEK